MRTGKKEIADSIVDKKQQKMIENFFAEKKTWSVEDIGMKFGACFVMIIGNLMFLIPIQDFLHDGFVLFYTWFILYLTGVRLYLDNFFTFRQDGKKKVLYNVVKGSPIKLNQLIIYQIRKVSSLCKWYAGVGMICQVGFAYVLYHQVTLENILVPIVMLWLIPTATVVLFWMPFRK